MVRWHLSGRSQPIDELRQDLRETSACVTVREPELLRDLADGARAENFLQLAPRDGKVGACADPRADVVGKPAVLKLADDPRQAAVLLNHLQRRREEWILHLLRAGTERAAQ